MKLKNSIRLFILCFLGLIVFQIQAQKLKMNLQEHDYSPYHFGFFVAVNQMDFSLKTNADAIGRSYDAAEYSDFPGASSVEFYGVQAEPHMGFTVGILGSLKLSKYFDLRFVPSLAFGERTLNYSIRKLEAGNMSEMINIKKNIISTHVDLPFYIKYKSKRLNNFRAYVIGGAKFSIDMAANSEKNQQQNEDLIRLAKNDILFETGVGFDYYFDFFKFAIELKMAYGIKNLLTTEGNMYSDAIDRLNSKIFQLSLTFE